MTRTFRLLFFGILMLLVSMPLIGQEFENGEIAITLNDYGRVRIYSPTFETIQIDRFSALVGMNFTKVFDYKNDAGILDTTRSIENPTISDYELFVSTDNSYSGAPPNFIVNINVYGWNSGGYALAKFVIINHEANGLNPIIGFEAIAEIDGVYGFESTEYISDMNTMDLFVGDASTHVGYKILSHPLRTLHSIDWVDGYSDSEILFWENLNYGSIDSIYESGSEGSVNFMALKASSMNKNDSVTVWVAMAVGADREAMKANMLIASSKYETITGVKKEKMGIPQSYALNQNYPNPFNPSTKISFSLTDTEFVLLSVYNSLGQKIGDLVNEELNSGNYIIDFNGSKLSSGIYYYKLTTEKFTDVKKMMLLK